MRALLSPPGICLTMGTQCRRTQAHVLARLQARCGTGTMLITAGAHAIHCVSTTCATTTRLVLPFVSDLLGQRPHWGQQCPSLAEREGLRLTSGASIGDDMLVCADDIWGIMCCRMNDEQESDKSSTITSRAACTLLPEHTQTIARKGETAERSLARRSRKPDDSLQALVPAGGFNLRLKQSLGEFSSGTSSRRQRRSEPLAAVLMFWLAIHVRVSEPHAS
jgi:hypothetical protein